MMRKVLFVVAVLAMLAWPNKDAHAAWVLDNWSVTVTYTVPVPAGFTATKERVTVVVPKEKMAATVESFRQMMGDIQESFADADPYKGWAPFTFGISTQPNWKQVP